MDRLIVTYGKFQQQFQLANRAFVVKSEQDQLISDQTTKLKSVQDPIEGLSKRLDDSRRKADQAYAMKYVKENNDSDPAISGGTPSNNDLRDILRVLQK